MYKVLPTEKTKIVTLEFGMINTFAVVTFLLEINFKIHVKKTESRPVENFFA
jgi:hypothetical protein